MPGLTAYVGLLTIGQPKPGETVVVAAASGAVGSLVGQIAKIKGCRAVGIAGGPRSAATSRRNSASTPASTTAPPAYEELKEAAPDGIDVDFENVGGPVFDAVLRLLNAFARVPVCGLIAQYNATEPYGISNLRSVLTNRVRMQGFIVSDRMELWPRALADLGQWVADGKIKYRETVAHGLERAPQAFLGMLRGENFGKQVVKLT